MPDCLQPDWSAPGNVRAIFTLRSGGFSRKPFDSLNLGAHVGDEPNMVEQNRQSLPVLATPFWLNQTHSNVCLEVTASSVVRDGDAAFTRQPGQVLAVQVADCVSILVSNVEGSLVAVIHAGWRGLANGIIRRSLDQFGTGDLIVWIGPSIGPCHYEVGDDVRREFPDPSRFKSAGGGWLMDLGAIAEDQLRQAGVQSIRRSRECTYCERERYFSYRRDGVTGRMAGIIWME